MSLTEAKLEFKVIEIVAGKILTKSNQITTRVKLINSSEIHKRAQ